MIKGSRYVIAVPNLQTSAAFYRDVLGFEIITISDPGWLFFRKDRCFIMAGECPDAIPPDQLGDHSYFAYLEVDDIEELYKTVVAKNVQVVKALRAEPWQMREFGIRTADGHRIMFGSPLSP
jgi:uncharacterized glyoxalase superfamily protein PhnB